MNDVDQYWIKKEEYILPTNAATHADARPQKRILSAAGNKMEWEGDGEKEGAEDQR